MPRRAWPWAPPLPHGWKVSRATSPTSSMPGDTPGGAPASKATRAIDSCGPSAEGDRLLQPHGACGRCERGAGRVGQVRLAVSVDHGVAGAEGLRRGRALLDEREGDVGPGHRE